MSSILGQIVCKWEIVHVTRWLIEIPDGCSLAATSSCTMTEGVSCRRKGWVCVRSRSLTSAMCRVCVPGAGRTHWSQPVRNGFSWFKPVFKPLMELLVLVLVDSTRAAAGLLPPHTIMHLQAFIYFNCCENTSITFSMFSVNTTSRLEIPAEHQPTNG